MKPARAQAVENATGGQERSAHEETGAGQIPDTAGRPDGETQAETVDERPTKPDTNGPSGARKSALAGRHKSSSGPMVHE